MPRLMREALLRRALVNIQQVPGIAYYYYSVL
jgi:hypothetical protein